MLAAVIAVFWQCFQPDLTGQKFANASWMAPRLGHHNLTHVNDIQKTVKIIARFMMAGASYPSRQETYQVSAIPQCRAGLICGLNAAHIAVRLSPLRFQ